MSYAAKPTSELLIMNPSSIAIIFKSFIVEIWEGWALILIFHNNNGKMFSYRGRYRIHDWHLVLIFIPQLNLVTGFFLYEFSQ